MEVVIEIVEPGRRAPNVHRFDQSDIVIGRAWDADLIIADDEIDGRHARLVFEEQRDTFGIEDLDSANGIRVRGRRQARTGVLAFGESITIGQTTIRVHRIDDEVAPPRKHNAFEHALRRVGRPPVAVALAALAIVCTQYSDFMSNVSVFEWNVSLNEALQLGMGLAAWAIVWGAIAKILKHQMRGWTHLAMASLAVIALQVLHFFYELIAFNLMSPFVSSVMPVVIQAVTVLAWVWLALIVTTNLGHKMRFAVTGVVVTVFLAVEFVLPRFQTPDWTANVPLETPSLPPVWLVVPAKPSAHLETLVGASLARSEETATRKRAEQEDDS